MYAPPFARSHTGTAPVRRVHPSRPAIAPQENPRRRAGPERGAPRLGLPALAAGGAGDGARPRHRRRRRQHRRHPRDRRIAAGGVSEPRAHRQPRAPPVGRAEPHRRAARQAGAPRAGALRRPRHLPARLRAAGGRTAWWRGTPPRSRPRWTPVGSRCFQRAAAWVVDTPLGSGGAAHRGGRRSGYVDHGHHAGFRLDWFRAGRRLRPGLQPQRGRRARPPPRARRRPHLARCRDSGSATRCATTFSRWRGSTGSTAAAGRGRCSSIACGRACGRPSRRSTSRRWRACLALAPVHRAFLLGPAAYLALLVAVSLWIAARHRSTCGLWAGPALAAMHLPWGAGFLWQLATGRERGGAEIQLHGLSAGPATLPVPSAELEPTASDLRSPRRQAS